MFKISTIHRNSHLPCEYKNSKIYQLGDEIDLSNLNVGESKEIVFFNKKLNYYGINKYIRVE